MVTPINAFKRFDGVQLVPIGGGRALIALEHPHAIPQLELDIRDAIERGEIGVGERRVLEMTAGILRQARLSRGVSITERTIIVLESKGLRRKPQGGHRGAKP